MGIDTNILVRFLVEDDTAQTERAHAFLARARSSGDMVQGCGGTVTFDRSLRDAAGFTALDTGSGTGRTSRMKSGKA
jgi:predicted nucleic-acid-binding protein